MTKLELIEEIDEILDKSLDKYQDLYLGQYMSDVSKLSLLDLIFADIHEAQTLLWALKDKVVD